MSTLEKTTFAAKGRWKGILKELGVPDAFLGGKHGPCPFCEGTDRYRFINTEGSGSWVCNQCQPKGGSGMEFAIRFTGKGFAECAAEIDGILGRSNMKPEQRKATMTEAERRQALRGLWKASTPTVKGDLVDAYLRSRGVGFGDYHNLRTAEAISDGEGGIRPAMLGIVQAPDGSNVTIHRTFLTRDGRKAEMASPRKMMPMGETRMPDGSCVRLSGDRAEIGLAEGIETALSVERLFGTPCWAVLNTGMMEKWTPPTFVEDVTIYADCDGKYGGQRAAYVLAHKLATAGLQVNVRVPDMMGEDWNDVLRAGKMAA